MIEFKVGDRVSIVEEYRNKFKRTLQDAEELYVGRLNHDGSSVYTLISPNNIGWRINEDVRDWRTRFNGAIPVNEDWRGWNKTIREGWLLHYVNGICKDCISNCKVNDKLECDFYES